MSDDIVVGDGVTLVRHHPRRPVSRWPSAPGWPHADTAAALAFAERGGRTWLVVDPAGTVVGECGTKAPPDEAGTVEIGYGLAGPSRGRGLGGRAVATLVEALRPDLAITTLRACVQPTNLASRRLLERLGFTLAEAGQEEVVYELPLGRSTPSAAGPTDR